ncbi:MAG: hypothetical protein R3C42_02730 [Parvularculaceae bacterium]
MKIAVLRETKAGESRVAASPETVKKFVALGGVSRLKPAPAMAPTSRTTLSAKPEPGSRRHSSERFQQPTWFSGTRAGKAADIGRFARPDSASQRSSRRTPAADSGRGGESQRRSV